LSGRAGQLETSASIAGGIDTAGQPQLAFRKQLLLAELAVARKRPEQALALLQAPPPESSDDTLLGRYHRVRAEAFRLSGNLMERGHELGERDLLLQDPQTRLNNQLTIIQTYATLSDTALEKLEPSPPGIQGGWMELARIIKGHGNDPERARPLIAAWRERFPNHPAMPELLDGYYQKLKGQYRRPGRIAILLPENGRYAGVARALRDGFLAAYYQEEPDLRPQLLFYDSTDPEDVWPLYQQAVAAGADLVVGPLNKEGVAQLARAGELEAPVLTLNEVTPEVLPPADLYQFGLSPEDEARQVAERAWIDGFTRGLVLTPSGGWGDRIFEAFRDRWEQLGGTLLKQQEYDPRENDFAQPIRALLNLDQASARHQQLQRLLGKRLEFEPQRRQDAEFLFLVAKVQKAREIRPQLQFHHAADLPVYATSHAYAGKQSPKADQDLEGLVFLDIPWLLINGDDDPLSRERLARLLPDSQIRYQRLYAMGIDSYQLLPHLARLQNSASEMVAGKTGNLYLDRINHIHRQLVWAKIRDGMVEMIGYAPRIEDANGEFPAIEPQPAAGKDPASGQNGTPRAPGTAPEHQLPNAE
jgi:outer membrane PBP1 activator LpoA protein